ncbi:endonuclease MutS2 [Acholeplasma equirhinis]|uniref:endonuclease MutS2 n=1 Tax=Acholeplasma equirhinis TaxID=555393 RepID=UPI00197AED17|nr:endonuclease MutS2 [Acholeplasma equirhinis]MBN3490480.1 endonuclease MutS2 [Acholeplasma equirhinis]
MHIILQTVSTYTFSKSASEAIIELTPQKDYKTVYDQLNTTDDCLQMIYQYGKLPFFEHYDIHNVLQKLRVSSQLSIDEFLGIRKLISMEIAFDRYQQQFESKLMKIKELILSLENHKEVLTKINQIIDHEGLVYDHASTKLSEIRRQIKIKRTLLDKLLGQVLTKYADYLNESLIVKRNDRYVIPVKDTYKNKIKGVIHDISASGQTIYIEPDDIRQVTQDLEFLNRGELAEIEIILRDLTNRISPYQETLVKNLNIFIELDMVHAKACYAQTVQAIKPRINKEGKISLKDARHPLLDKEKVVPIDVKLSPEQPIMLITGPNTGGKTVALKTIGLFTLMMQVGLLIPANEQSELAIFDHIFADIGDEQSIQQSLSTFSSHLTKIKNMFDQMSGQSLILLDELGSGTDPVEGVSLAIAIIDEIRKNKQNRLIVTTHYSELKLYAFEQDDILNASVAFDQESLKPLYKLQLGIAGSSHALKIAKRLGLKKDVILHAENLLEGRKSNLAKSIEKLNFEQQAVENLREELKKKELELQKQIQSYKDKTAYLEKEKNQLLDQIKQKELKRYEKLKQEAIDLIEELSNKQSLSKPEQADLKGKLNKQESVNTKLTKEKLNVGDYVYIETYQQEGEIIGIKKDKFIVAFGQFELEFSESQLRKTDKPKTTVNKPKKVAVVNTPSKKGSYELDLRGVRFEDVKHLMDKAIDDALLSNIPSIRVIHGFGTGAVRKAVYDYIKQSSYIKSHRYGGEGEGLNGVTIISL